MLRNLKRVFRKIFKRKPTLDELRFLVAFGRKFGLFNKDIAKFLWEACVPFESF